MKSMDEQPEEQSETINHWMVRARTSGTKAEDLWNDAKEYFMWCEANPIFKQEMIRQTGALVNVACPRPFNLAAMCIHCGVTVSYINSMAKNHGAGEYHLVAQKILSVIYSQNLEYAMVGIFNSAVTIRKLNLGAHDDESKAPAVININVIENGAPSMLTNEQDLKDEEPKR